MFCSPALPTIVQATFTAAWFKIFLANDTGVYRDLIFGTGPDSLCKHAQMENCYVNQ